jgi:hypothetical protein
MAITVENKPIELNVTDTKLVYAVSSSNALNPQFQYVTDIYESGNSERLTRIFSYPNPQGYGVIEVGNILGDNLEYDNDWTASTAVTAQNSIKTFELAFSESYATSISGATTVFSGGASEEITVFLGTVDPNGGSYNFLNAVSESVPNITYNPSLYRTGISRLMTDNTETFISKDNALTFSVLIPKTGLNVNGNVEYRVQFISGSGDIIQTTDIAQTVTGDNRIVTYPIGSGSATFDNSFQNTDWEQITLTFLGNASGVDDALLYTYHRVRPLEKDGESFRLFTGNGPVPNTDETIIPPYKEGVTFAFINDYGIYEYFTVGNPVKKVTNVERDFVDLPQVDYSGTGQYDITRRGEKAYNTSYTDEFEVTTDYYNQAVSKTLTTLLDSPEVFVQQPEGFIPIVITNATYDWNINENRQKLFQYTINYRYSNQRYSR